MKPSLRVAAAVALWALAGACPALAGEHVLREICPGRLWLESEKAIRFTGMEQPFLCGDPETPAWRDIPPAQVRFHMSTFLQARGYFRPEFEERGEGLIVRPGPRKLVSRFQVDGAPPEVDWRRRRRVRHRVLSPKFLNEMEGWVRHEAKSRGYPCPVAKGRANVETGEIVVDLEPGPRQKIDGIQVEEIPGMDSGVLRRFDAFQPGEWFNEDYLLLSADRAEKSGLVQNTYFESDCGAEGVALRQKTFAGKPRLLRVGVGADTEEYAIVKASWKHTRLGRKASNFEVAAYASYKRQQLDISSELYFLAPESRWHLFPVLSFSHERESDFHFISGSAKLLAATSWDWQESGLRFAAGPDLNYVDTFRGAQPGLTRFLSLEYEAEWMSHYYEWFQNDPRTGFYLRLTGNLTNKNLLSELSAQRFRVDGQYLYNFRNLDPPWLVFGVRGAFMGTFVDRTPENLAKLPPNYKFYLGGSADLRGFGRKELPNPDGALSAAFASFELRFANWIPYGVQPFVFLDAGILGDQAFRFKLPFYYSPGFGIRYHSPIGVFRTTLARGFKAGGDDGNPDNTHFQFFISYGEEF
ncbi:MAG: BamA/TamA family outer membrane protein [Deltaproteobacteria bacterium]|nr:BamA/TamA family outer membrane protein [Deltaproteobacteria bacterium]